MNRYLRTAIAAIALCCGTAAAQTEHFETRLSVVPIDPTTSTTITGHGQVEAVLDGQRLSIEGSFTGLNGAATVAQLHRSPATGVRGPSIRQFAIQGGTEGRFEATLELEPSDVEALRDGRLYLQLHSEAAPDGNLWGWLLP